VVRGSLPMSRLRSPALIGHMDINALQLWARPPDPAKTLDTTIVRNPAFGSELGRVPADDMTKVMSASPL
jgi:hypothetical protein